MSPKQEHQFKNKKDKVGFMGDAEETLHFYDSVGAILKKNVLQHLNLEWMRLGNRAVLLCQALVGNTSLSTVHLSNNLIDAPALATIKWNLSIGIEHGLQPASYDVLAERKQTKAIADSLIKDVK